MTTSTPRKRKYDSTRRKARAGETRLRILDAAHALLLERGYAGATMEAIAAKADVASETIYAVFKNKRRLVLHLLNVLSATPAEEKVPMPERAGPRLVSQERDQRRQLQMFARYVANNLQGVAVISEIMNIAARAERDMDSLMQRLSQQRWDHMGLLVRQVAANGPLKDGMDAAAATDLVWILTSPEVFLLTRRDRGWSKEKYIRWLADTLAQALLP